MLTMGLKRQKLKRIMMMKRQTWLKMKKMIKYSESCLGVLLLIEL